MKKEPSTIISVIVALASEIIGLMVAFNIDITDAQRTAIIGTLTAMATAIALVGPIIRQFVWAPESVEQVKQEAKDAGYQQAVADALPTSTTAPAPRPSVKPSEGVARYTRPGV